jgi:hypothetical protein
VAVPSRGWSAMTARLAVFTRCGHHQIAANCSAAALRVLIRRVTCYRPRACLTYTFLVERVGILDLVEGVQFALNKDGCAITVLANVPGIVTHDNQ